MKKIVLAIMFLIGCATEIAKDEPMRDYGDGIQRVDRRGIASPRGWQVSGKLTMRDTLNRMQMQADFEEPGSYTVQFGTSPKVVPGAFGRKSMAKAKIIWAVEGGSVTREVSIANGTSISGVAQGVIVSVSDDTRSGGPAFPVGFDPTYLVNMQVVKGLRPSIERPPSLMPPDTSIGGANNWAQGAVSLPAGPSATALQSFDTTSGIVSLHVSVSSSAGTLVPMGSVLVEQGTSGGSVLQYDDPRVMDWIPLNPFCDAVQIWNFNAFAVQVSMMYGIDG